MLSSFIRIVAKDGSNLPETPQVIPVVKNVKAPRKKRTKKLKSVEEEDVEFSKFVPLKEEKVDVSGYETGEDDGMFSSIADEYKDEANYEDENEIYKKQDMEWADVMKEYECDDAKTDYDTDSISAVGESVDIDEMSVDGDASADDISVAEDDDMLCGDDEFGSFYSGNIKSDIKIKEPKVFRGVVLFEDDDFIP